jgi:hypothetical protein
MGKRLSLILTNQNFSPQDTYRWVAIYVGIPIYKNYTYKNINMEYAQDIIWAKNSPEVE